ncbi:hypothetical protein ACFVTF_15750 [Kitasatospora sp. NPDC057940]|uniref:hypothetical protein n=1 Tax=Kitasatospora sp. NPDC057940 TaxID=3346285 RepID=UPI0036DC3481
MTVLHSRNADAADPADVADAADVKDPQDAKATTAETDLREDLGRYAELGAFTLTADTHAWYAAVDTVATPEDARAASTALAELRGRDLHQTWDAVAVLAADAKLDEPDTVAKAALLVEMLQRVHRTSATLTTAAYDADLGALAAATADGTWRRENGVKLSWLRARSLRKQATALATDRRIRREDLHEALASAEVERRAWAALAPAGTLPVVPADGALVERTAQAFEAINTGLRGLARLLPDHDLDGLAFAELVDLVERLAADEGTLYRLPTIRGLRTTLEEAGLGDLLTELAAARADRRAAEAAFAARQALAGGQRDGLAGEGSAVEAPAPAPASAEETVTDADADAGSEAGSGEAEAEAVVETAEAAEEEVTEEAPSAVVVSLPAPSPAADDLVAAATAALAETTETMEAEAAVEVPAVEAVAEVELAEETPVLEDTPVVEQETTEEAAEPETVAEAAEVEASVAEVEPVVEPAAVVEPVAEVEVVEVVEPAPAVAVVEPVAEPVTEAAAVVEPVAEVEVVEVVEPAPAVEPVAEVEPAVEPEAVVEVPVAEVEPVAVVEPVAEAEPVAESAAVVEPVAEVEAVEEAPAAVVVESVEKTEAIEDVQPVTEVEPETVAEAVVVEAPVAEADEPVAEPAAVAEPVAEAEVVEVVEEAPAVEPAPAPVAAGRPEKPDFTPGRPVTAYSADELLAVVRWVDGDGVKRTEEELLRAAMKELGFARLGPRIKEALGAAVTAARG